MRPVHALATSWSLTDPQERFVPSYICRTSTLVALGFAEENLGQLTGIAKVLDQPVAAFCMSVERDSFSTS